MTATSATSNQNHCNRGPEVLVQLLAGMSVRLPKVRRTRAATKLSFHRSMRRMGTPEVPADGFRGFTNFNNRSTAAVFS